MSENTKKIQEITYREDDFAIDIIIDAYHIRDPLFVSEKIKEDLNMDVSVSKIVDFLNYTEDFEKESWSINSKQIFYE